MQQKEKGCFINPAGFTVKGLSLTYFRVTPSNIGEIYNTLPFFLLFIAEMGGSQPSRVVEVRADKSGKFQVVKSGGKTVAVAAGAGGRKKGFKEVEIVHSDGSKVTSK